MYDYTTYTYKYYYYPYYSYYSSYGYGEITYNSTTGEFSFPATIGSGTTYITVYAYDSGYYNSHGHYIYVNNTYGYSEYSYKPSGDNNAGDARAQAHLTEFHKMMARQRGQ